MNTVNVVKISNPSEYIRELRSNHMASLSPRLKGPNENAPKMLDIPVSTTIPIANDARLFASDAITTTNWTKTLSRELHVPGKTDLYPLHPSSSKPNHSFRYPCAMSDNRSAIDELICPSFQHKQRS
jgi:hypothetical protein